MPKKIHTPPVLQPLKKKMQQEKKKKKKKKKKKTFECLMSN